MYDETIEEIVRISRDISVQRSESDGRIASATNEGPFLMELRDRLLAVHPEWDICISPPRASCDVQINSLRINLKLTDCKTADNSMNKPSVFYSITGSPAYPYSSNWNEFLDKLQDAKASGVLKRTRDKTTEYHYLVKNKITGDVLLKPIFDIHTYVSNASNDLQINWKNEFAHREYATADSEYLQKVASLLKTIQTSVQEMIARTKRFADTDFNSFLE